MRRDKGALLRTACHPKRSAIVPTSRRRAKSSSKPPLENSWILYAYGYSDKAISVQGFSLPEKTKAWQSLGALQFCVMPARVGFSRAATIWCSPTCPNTPPECRVVGVGRQSPMPGQIDATTDNRSSCREQTVRLDRTRIFARLTAAGNRWRQVLARVLPCDVQRPPEFSRCVRFNHLDVTK